MPFKFVCNIENAFNVCYTVKCEKMFIEGEHLNEQVTVSASIVSYNCYNQLYDAVSSVLKQTKKYPLGLYVFDNGSFDGSDLKIKTNFPDVTVRQVGYNSGFGHGHNLIMNEDTGKYHAVINPDISVSDDVISYLADVLEAEPDAVMVTPKVLFPDGREQKLPKRNPTFSYCFLGRLGKFGGIFKKKRDEYTRADEEFNGHTEIDFCTGCFFLIRTEVFRKLGGFDENFFMYFEDADLTRRAKEYGKVLFCPEVSVTHKWNRDSAKKLKYLLIHLKSYHIYMKKWRKSKK